MVLLCLSGCLVPASAAADWYITPFLGLAFGGSTTLVDLDQAVGDSKLVVGGSVAQLSDGLLGVELDYALYPRFFQGDAREPLIESSRVQTLTGSLMVAAPLSLTRESFRPYLVGGLGWMGVSSLDLLDVIPVERNLLALGVGVGAIGMLGDRAGLRFEVRHFTNLDRDVASGTEFGRARLSFWRATVGATLRY